jgi:hypothetical protein
VAIHKRWFSLTVKNIRTGDVHTILHTRATPISIDTLFDYKLNMPNLYDELTSRNLKNRGTYIRGGRQKPLRLLNEEEFLEAVPDDEDNPSEDDLSLGQEDDI